jgi:hypothetical protein
MSSFFIASNGGLPVAIDFLLRLTHHLERNHFVELEEARLLGADGDAKGVRLARIRHASRHDRVDVAAEIRDFAVEWSARQLEPRRPARAPTTTRPWKG